MRYLVIIEEGPENLSAYVPDLPGCVSAGATHEETLRNIHEAIQGHLEIMRAHGETIPEPTSHSEYVEVPLAV